MLCLAFMMLACGYSPYGARPVSGIMGLILPAGDCEVAFSNPADEHIRLLAPNIVEIGNPELP